MSTAKSQNSNLPQFYHQLIRPEFFDTSQLVVNKNQVAGHAGFFSLEGHLNKCLKPFNTKCVRGRREHLFYQLVEYYKRINIESTTSGDLISETNKKRPLLYYRDFSLLTYPNPSIKCNCIINEALFKLLSEFVADFHYAGHIDTHHFNVNCEIDCYLRSVYSEELECPCYGQNPKRKSSCSRDYERVDFLCLKDLTAHCKRPCIMDIKIGQITYDPMAIKEKVLEQSNKYRRLREFGFRILGMKLGDKIRDKNYGKTLETSDEVFEALDSFFTPLDDNLCKSVVIKHILGRLQILLTWFENENINQLKFFSSSVLIVYDSHVKQDRESINLTSELVDGVRVSMIDFAHVFHTHDINENTKTCGRDENYIFGLRRLIEFFIKLESRHRSLLLHPQDSHLPRE